MYTYLVWCPTWSKNLGWYLTHIHNRSTLFKYFSNFVHILFNFFYNLKRVYSGVLLRRQILNVNYHVKCSSENCWFLVCCFFSVIWNISQINIFKTKCKLKCQNDFLGKLFLKSGNTVFIFYVFITEIYLTNIWRDNWCSVFYNLKGLC